MISPLFFQYFFVCGQNRLQIDSLYIRFAKIARGNVIFFRCSDRLKKPLKKPNAPQEKHKKNFCRSRIFAMQLLLLVNRDSTGKIWILHTFHGLFHKLLTKKRGVFKGFHRVFNKKWKKRGLKHVDCGKSDRILQFVNRGGFFDKKRRQDVQKFRQNSGKTATVKSHIRVCCIFHSFVI